MDLLLSLNRMLLQINVFKWVSSHSNGFHSIQDALNLNSFPERDPPFEYFSTTSLNHIRVSSQSFDRIDRLGLTMRVMMTCIDE